MSGITHVLARTLYGEARNQGLAGLFAVANVIMNRVNADLGHDGKPDWWGEGVEAVCLKKYQFSCWLESDPNRAKLLAVTDADPVFQRCLSVEASALAGELEDITGGATHYYERHMPRPPAWVPSMTFTVRIGDHLFYR